jgi:hypothetical protein
MEEKGSDQLTKEGLSALAERASKGMVTVGAGVFQRAPCTCRMANSPVDFAAEVAKTPLNSLELLFTGLGLYSRLGRLDATDTLQHTAEVESDI